MKFTIQRLKWYRGQGGTESRLLLPNEKMCCLGFFALALGATPDQIREKTDPQEVPGVFTKDAKWLLDFLEDETTVRNNSNEACSLIKINDEGQEHEYHDEEADREQKIAEIFAKHGVEVEYVD